MRGFVSLVVLLLVIGVAGVATAQKSEIDEIRARARHLVEEAKARAKQGKSEEAERLQRQAAMMLEEARRRELGGPRKGDANPEAHLDEAMRRIRHLREAQEHLQQAGAIDIAKATGERAEAMEREVRVARERLEKERGHEKRPVKGEASAVIEELRREIGKLREELNEVRRLLRERR